LFVTIFPIANISKGSCSIVRAALPNFQHNSKLSSSFSDRSLFTIHLAVMRFLRDRYASLFCDSSFPSHKKVKLLTIFYLGIPAPRTSTQEVFGDFQVVSPCGRPPQQRSVGAGDLRTGRNECRSPNCHLLLLIITMTSVGCASMVHHGCQGVQTA